jgi:hypothetical protein
MMGKCRFSYIFIAIVISVCMNVVFSGKVKADPAVVVDPAVVKAAIEKAAEDLAAGGDPLGIIIAAKAKGVDPQTLANLLSAANIDLDGIRGILAGAGFTDAEIALALAPGAGPAGGFIGGPGGIPDIPGVGGAGGGGGGSTPEQPSASPST